MESYEDFIQRHYSGQNEDELRSPVTPPSVIMFHGAPILPPLLNEQRRDEMRRLRETAVSLMKRRKEEEAHSDFTDVRIGDADDIISSAPPTLITCHPLTSTAHEGRPTNQLRASPDPEDQSLESTQVTVLFEGVGHKTHRSHDALDGHTHSQMMSSGYITNDNTDISWMEDRAATTLPATTGSDIITHAPVDGAIVEEEEDVVPPLKQAEDVGEASDPDDGPYRMSLQNLLKKSQEYRRRQRLLRSQAKALKPDESDKENQERPLQTWRTELRKAREKKKSEEDGGDERPVPAGSLSDSKQTSRFSSIPTPKFCLSPVRCKKVGGTSSLLRKALSQSDHSAPADRHGNVLRPANGSGAWEQTEQIAQLELNLSSLKALISDLESTLTLSQTGSPGETTAEEDHGIGLSHTRSCFEKTHTSSGIGSSYDVHAPSGLWSQLTPETGGHEGVSRVKRRLMMNETELETGGAPSSTPAAPEDPLAPLLEEEEQRRQQLQSLALRYQFLRSVSFLCPDAGSRLEDTPTSASTESTDAPVCVSARCGPPLAALVKGFLTRRLLRTERVCRLIRTVQDTQVFLLSLQHQTPISSRNDRMLQERVTLQLRAARLELHELFFSSSVSDRMRLIRQDREWSREQRHKAHPRPAVSLSAATRKALERRRLVMLQQRSADRKPVSPSSEDSWTLVPKICRASRKMAPLRGAP